MEAAEQELVGSAFAAEHFVKCLTQWQSFVIRHWWTLRLFIIIGLVGFLFLRPRLNHWISCQVRLLEIDAICKQDKVVLVFHQILNILHDLALHDWNLDELSDSATQKRGRIAFFFRDIRFHAHANLWASLEDFSCDITWRVAKLALPK